MVNQPGGSPVTLESWTADQLCKSDLVVVASFNRQVSGLTQDNGLVISDYYVTIEQQLYSRNGGTTLLPGSSLVVNGLGGSTVLTEGRASTTVAGATAFQRGMLYLLFLKSIPGDSDFELTDLGGAFILKPGENPVNTYRLTQNKLKSYLSALDSNALVNTVRLMATTAPSCKESGR
ncbi:MAG: hypothetical protein WBW33_15840 [Bryobacteraceae bacterium]